VILTVLQHDAKILFKSWPNKTNDLKSYFYSGETFFFYFESEKILQAMIAGEQLSNYLP